MTASPSITYGARDHPARCKTCRAVYPLDWFQAAGMPEGFVICPCGRQELD